MRLKMLLQKQKLREKKQSNLKVNYEFGSKSKEKISEKETPYTLGINRKCTGFCR